MSLRQSLCLVVVTIAVLFLPSLSHADTAAEMFSACKPLAEAHVEEGYVKMPGTQSASKCWGAFAAIQDETTLIDGEDRHIFPFGCVPATAKRTDLIAVFVEYVRRHPEQRQEKFVSVVIDAFGAAYPCQ
jgi:hypothetical protein